MSRSPFILVICDGWGELPGTFGNAIAQAATPELDRIRENWPHTTVSASGEPVGLPDGQMGNSEVGHLTIGAGRVIRQPLTRQNHEIATGKFYENETLITAIELAKSRNAALHVMGLVSPGGVHSLTDGALATVKLAAKLGLTRVHVHAFTDGRDTPPTSAHGHLMQFEEDLSQIGIGQVASVSGRYYAMDRDNRWDRTQLVYKMLTDSDHLTHASATAYINESVAKGETDEFIKPISVSTNAKDRVRLEDGDVVIMFNFRPDRVRQLTHALVDADFKDFTRDRIVKDLHLVTFTEYDRSLGVPIAFPKEDTSDTLAEVISKQNLHQYHIAETEKYAHVTYFLNGGQELAFEGEDRELVPSPKVATYDLAPAMNAQLVADTVTARMDTNKDDFIVVNFANADMVGHTGDLEATKLAITAVDTCLGQIVAHAAKLDSVVLITADHGNAEYKIDPDTKKPLTAHTTSPVPAILCGTAAKALRSGASLQDIAPTVLEVMGITKPAAMTGTSLIVPA